MLLELMLQNPDVPTVMWIDADAIFTNMGIVIPSRDGVIMACDVNGLNAGVMVMENSEPVRAMLYAAYTSGKALFAGGPWSDQMAIRYFLSGPPYSDLLRVVPQRYMNSYWPGAYVYPGCESAWWKDGDWILHLPGMSYDERMSVLVNLA